MYIVECKQLNRDFKPREGNVMKEMPLLVEIACDCDDDDDEGTKSSRAHTGLFNFTTSESKLTIYNQRRYKK